MLQRIIISGGAGFIGSHVVEFCLARGVEVPVLIRWQPVDWKIWNLIRRLRVLAKDLLTCRPEDFSGRYDAFVHLAALASMQRSWAAPAMTAPWPSVVFIPTAKSCGKVGGDLSETPWQASTSACLNSPKAYGQYGQCVFLI